MTGAAGSRTQFLGHSEAHTRRDLLGAQKILVRGMLEILALERDDALVAGHVGALVDGHGEMTMAQQRARIGGTRCDGGRDPRGVEAGAGAHLAGRGVVDDQHADRPVALGLQDEAALEFQGRAEQHREHDGFAEKLRDRHRIAMTRQDGVDGRPEAYHPPAQVERFDLKGQDRVVLGGGRRRTRRDVRIDIRHDR